MRSDKNKLFQGDQMQIALKQSFIKLDPRVLFRNPVMFTVEIGTVVMLIVTVFSFANKGQGSFGYNLTVFLVLLLTVLFANFAEAIAEARGKAQAESLRKTREETPARLLVNGKEEKVMSSQLKKGDVFICETGDNIPTDGIFTIIIFTFNPYQYIFKRGIIGVNGITCGFKPSGCPR